MPKTADIGVEFMPRKKAYTNIHILIPKRLRIYQRLDVKSDSFYARARFPPQKGYRVFSTKSSDMAEAIRYATNHYYDLAGRQSLNISTKLQSFQSLMLDWLEYKGRLRRTESTELKTTYHTKYDRFIKPWHLSANNLPDIINPIVKKVQGDNWNTRGVFTEAEYRRVRDFIMERAENDCYWRLGKVETSVHHTFKMERMRVFFLTASAFGCRPQELKALKFKHVKLIRDEKHDLEYSVIDLTSDMVKANPDGTVRHTWTRWWWRLHFSEMDPAEETQVYERDGLRQYGNIIPQNADVYDAEPP